MELVNEKKPVVNEKKSIKSIKCNICNGIGLVKTIKLRTCLCINVQRCYKCEKVNKDGLYNECESCWGTGKI